MKSLKTCTVTIMSNDLKRSIDFYCEVIGLVLIQNYAGHYAEIKAPGFKIGLHPTRNLIEGNAISLGFGVSNFNEEVEKLKEKQIEVTISQDGPIRLASFQDPDGNGLFLAEID